MHDKTMHLLALLQSNGAYLCSAKEGGWATARVDQQEWCSWMLLHGAVATASQGAGVRMTGIRVGVDGCKGNSVRGGTAFNPELYSGGTTWARTWCTAPQRTSRRHPPTLRPSASPFETTVLNPQPYTRARLKKLLGWCYQ